MNNLIVEHQRDIDSYLKEDDIEDGEKLWEYLRLVSITGGIMTNSSTFSPFYIMAIKEIIVSSLDRILKDQCIWDIVPLNEKREIILESFRNRIIIDRNGAICQLKFSLESMI